MSVDLGEYLKTNFGLTFTESLARQSIENPQIIKELIDISQSKKHPVDWRAAWVIDHIWKINAKGIEPFIPHLIDSLEKIESMGVKRHYIKVISMYPIYFVENGFVFDSCLKLILSQTTPIAIRAYCMDILKHFILAYPELSNECMPVFEDILTNGSKGEKAKVKIILKALDPKKKNNL